ncbi:unnamed protein product, partial [Ectocarpus sp. 12 AP-2014]
MCFILCCESYSGTPVYCRTAAGYLISIAWIMHSRIPVDRHVSCRIAWIMYSRNVHTHTETVCSTAVVFCYASLFYVQQPCAATKPGMYAYNCLLCFSKPRVTCICRESEEWYESVQSVQLHPSTSCQPS